MRRNAKHSDKDQQSDIRNTVWLSVLGVALLGIIAVSLSRKETRNPIDQSPEIASAAHHSLFGKSKRPVELAASSDAGERDADEIETIDFSVINDRSRWVDPAWAW